MKCLLTHLLGTQNTPINLSVVNWSFYLAPNQDLKNMYNYKKTEGDDRGWDGWMASPTQWTWVWVNSGSWWWTGRPGVLQFMGSQRVRHDWTDLNWTEISTIEWSHEPNHQWLVQAFSHCITLTLILLSLSSLYKNICDNAGLTRIIQDNLPISESFY